MPFPLFEILLSEMMLLREASKRMPFPLFEILLLKMMLLSEASRRMRRNLFEFMLLSKIILLWQLVVVAGIYKVYSTIVV